MYKLELVHVSSDNTVTRCLVASYEVLADAEQEANARNFHEIRFHGDRKRACYFWRVVWPNAED